MNGMDGMGWGGMWFGSIFWLVILGLIVWAVISMVNKNRGDKQGFNASQEESALDILKKRYAQGEITKAEFEEMKRDLR